MTKKPKGAKALERLEARQKVLEFCKSRWKSGLTCQDCSFFHVSPMKIPDVNRKSSCCSQESIINKSKEIMRFRLMEEGKL